MIAQWLEKDALTPTVVGRLEDVEVVLDIGCGIHPQKFIRPSVHVCCEPYHQYVEVLQQKVRNENDRTYVIIQGLWRDAIRMFPPKSVDTVFLVDVIEHLEKPEALELLKATEALARRQIAIFTPLGFLPQHHEEGGKDAWGLDGVHWQEHRSGWQPEDFPQDWEIFACKEFHFADNIGQSHPAPFGALWALKTFEKIKPTPEETRRHLINRIRKFAVEIHNDRLLSDIEKLLKTLVRVKGTPIREFYKQTVGKLRPGKIKE